MANTRDYQAVVGYEGTVKGSLYRPEIKGRLDVLSGYYYARDFGRKSIEPVDVDSILQQEKQSVPLFSYDSLQVNMDITFNERFFLRS